MCIITLIRRPQIKIKICYSRIYLVIVHTLAPHANSDLGQRDMNTIDISITNKILVCSKVPISIIDPAEILIQGNCRKSYFSKLFPEAGGPGKFFPVLGSAILLNSSSNKNLGWLQDSSSYIALKISPSYCRQTFGSSGSSRPAGALISFPEPSWISYSVHLQKLKLFPRIRHSGANSNLLIFV